MAAQNIKISAFAERSFRHTSATVWNSLSDKSRNCLGLTVEIDIQKTSQSLGYQFETAFDHCLCYDRLRLRIGLLRPTYGVF